MQPRQRVEGVEHLLRQRGIGGHAFLQKSESLQLKLTPSMSIATSTGSGTLWPCAS
jgi:hypothetical protein